VGALRIEGKAEKAWVEGGMVQRKYKNKQETLVAAALILARPLLETTSGRMSRYYNAWLGDQNCSRFGFDGIFKHLLLMVMEYRGLIDSNSNIAFFNEDNKK